MTNVDFMFTKHLDDPSSTPCKNFEDIQQKLFNIISKYSFHYLSVMVHIGYKDSMRMCAKPILLLKNFNLNNAIEETYLAEKLFREIFFSGCLEKLPWYNPKRTDRNNMEIERFCENLRNEIQKTYS